MTQDSKSILELLKAELNFIEKGGYGRSVRTPQVPTSIFVDSPSCLNYADANRPHPCSECKWIEFVPLEERAQSIPCHHIRLNGEGETIETFEAQGNQQQMEDALRNWLRSKIKAIEEEQVM